LNAETQSFQMCETMLGDAADYSEYKNGRRATALVFSAGTFAMKFGSGVAGAITLAILNFYNYDGQAAIKTPEMLEGIRLELVGICFWS